MIKLIGNYAKRLGLPGYSSHQFSVSIETELSDSGDVQAEAARIYQLLQDAVDREIQETGFVPTSDYGQTQSHRDGNGSNGHRGHPMRRNGENGGTTANRTGERWNCSDKQKEFILKLLNQNDLPRGLVEDIAMERFGVSLANLNKLQASGLISELLETIAASKPGQGRNGKGGRR